MKIRFHRDIEVGETGTVTISWANGRYFVSFCVDDQTARKPLRNTGWVGIDRGVTKNYETSDDDAEIAAHVKRWAVVSKKLKEIEKRVDFLKSRRDRLKVKKSKNYYKETAKIARKRDQANRKKQAYLHEATALLTSKYGVVALEKLATGNMTKSAKGTVEKPGKNVAAKAGLNKAILRSSWFEFKRQIEYKIKEREGYVVEVNAAYTSQDCPECGHRHKDNRKTQSDFLCLDCGFALNADKVGAINVLNRALKEAGDTRVTTTQSL